MLTPESEYKLKKIKPERLLQKEKNDLEGFFLILALIYNDLKGLLHLHKDFYDNHPKPLSGTEKTGYSGEYNGMTLQFYKSLAGLINELLRFIEEYNHIYDQPEFKFIISKLENNIKIKWSQIIDASLNRENKDADSIGYKLMLIRNHITFHYYQSEKVLRKAYVDFFSDPNRLGADAAYYSLGDTMEDTRFFYADAAIQFYLMNTSNENTTDYEKHRDDLNKLQQDSFKLLRSINLVLANMLKEFINHKHRERKQH